MDQQEWKEQVDNLFDILDPKNGLSQEQSDKAVEYFMTIIKDNSNKVKSNDVSD